MCGYPKDHFPGFHTSASLAAESLLWVRFQGNPQTPIKVRAPRQNQGPGTQHTGQQAPEQLGLGPGAFTLLPSGNASVGCNKNS